MHYDIVLAGVGGQGVLSVSAVIASAAMAEGLHVKQSEVHGMAQRGGAVVAHLRLGDAPIASETIPRGCAALILALEPLESLRYLAFLRSDGSVITAQSPVLNIDDYPPIDDVLTAVRALPRSRLIDGQRVAREVGSARAMNMVLVGAASLVVPVTSRGLERAIAARFASKGDAMVDLNLRAFRAGREAAAA